MEAIYEELTKHKPKHNLRFDFNFSPDDGWIVFTVLDCDFKNRSVSIYDFHSCEDVRQRVNKIKKLMNNKRKALEFIGELR